MSPLTQSASSRTKKFGPTGSDGAPGGNPAVTQLESEFPQLGLTEFGAATMRFYHRGPEPRAITAKPKQKTAIRAKGWSNES